MPKHIRTGSGERVSVIAPTRYYAYRTDGLAYPLTAAADFFADCGTDACGFSGVDLSLELIAGLHEFDYDDSYRGVLYAFANRAAARGLSLPVCHLPFYMPDPDNTPAMANFVREVRNGLRAAARLGIPDAVIHPIVRHESRRSRRAWLEENLAYLAPIRELAAYLGVTLCIENMVGRPYTDTPSEAVFGARAADIRELSDRLDAMTCWDFGHANLSGLCQSAELEQLRGRLRTIHIHDNDGRIDNHRIPGEAPGAAVDWDDAAEGLRLADYLSTSNRCLDMELKSSDLPNDRSTRLAHAARALAAARAFADKL